MPAEMQIRANYFAEAHYVKTDPKTGVARNRSGARILSLTSDFLIGLRNALIFECGKSADVVLKTAGKKWGRSFGHRLEHDLSEFYGRPLGELPLALFQALIVEAFSHHGLGKLSLDTTLHDKGVLVCTVSDPVYSELIENPAGPTEPMLAGILAGLFSHLSGQDLDCAQSQCQACGAPDSRFVLSLPTRLSAVADLVAEGRTHAEIVATVAQTRG